VGPCFRLANTSNPLPTLADWWSRWLLPHVHTVFGWWPTGQALLSRAPMSPSPLGRVPRSGTSSSPCRKARTPQESRAQQKSEHRVLANPIGVRFQPTYNCALILPHHDAYDVRVFTCAREISAAMRQRDRRRKNCRSYFLGFFSRSSVHPSFSRGDEDDRRRRLVPGSVGFFAGEGHPPWPTGERETGRKSERTGVLSSGGSSTEPRTGRLGLPCACGVEQTGPPHRA
jgi:hypothetical protein